MSVMAAVAAVEALRPEQKQFLKEARTRASMPARRWSESLAQMVEAGRVAVPASRTCLRRGILGLLLAIAAIFPAFVWPLLGLPALALGVGAVIWAQRQGAKLLGAGKGAFIERIEKFLLPCVRVLQRDMDVDEPLRLEVDLRAGVGDPVGPPRQIPGPFKNRSCLEVVEKLSRQPLLSVQARLADGSLLTCHVEDHVRTREITKRGASGKTKRKVKMRRRRRIAARLGLRADAWTLRAAAESAAPGGAGIAAATGERRHVLKVRRVVEIARQTSPAADLDEVFATVGSLYAQASHRQPAPAAAPGRQP